MLVIFGSAPDCLQPCGALGGRAILLEMFVEESEGAKEDLALVADIRQGDAEGGSNALELIDD